MSIAVKSRSEERTVLSSTVGVRVNLLPQATRDGARAARQKALVGAFAGALVLAMGAVYWHASGKVADAEAEFAAAQQQTVLLRQEVSELSAFHEMAAQRELALTGLTAALGGEVSVTGILQDFALVVPPDTEFTTLNLDLTASDDAVGTFNLTGRTLRSHAPGVEGALRQFDKVGSFGDLYLNASALDDVEGQAPGDRVVTFSIDGRFAELAATGRYTEGLPEELR